MGWIWGVLGEVKSEGLAVNFPVLFLIDCEIFFEKIIEFSEIFIQAC